MPFLGFATTSDLKEFATTKNLVTATDVEKFATTDALGAVEQRFLDATRDLGEEFTSITDEFNKGLATATDDLNTRIEMVGNCSQILNGIDVCSVPKYETVVPLREFKPSSLFSGLGNDTCLQINQASELSLLAGGREIILKDMAEFPSNYVCFNAETTAEYMHATGIAAKAFEQHGQVIPAHDMDRRFKEHFKKP